MANANPKVRHVLLLSAILMTYPLLRKNKRDDHQTAVPALSRVSTHTLLVRTQFIPKHTYLFTDSRDEGGRAVTLACGRNLSLTDRALGTAREPGELFVDVLTDLDVRLNEEPGFELPCSPLTSPWRRA